MLAKTLTAKQRQWLEHVKAADSGQESIATYALANNLRLKSIYQWKSKLVKFGVYTPTNQISEASFIQLKSTPSVTVRPGCTLKLTNGNHIEFHGELSAVSIRSIITSASRPR